MTKTVGTSALIAATVQSHLITLRFGGQSTGIFTIWHYYTETSDMHYPVCSKKSPPLFEINSFLSCVLAV